MAKNAKTENIPTFDTAAATDQLRTIAEKGMEQSGKAYAALKENTEALQKAVEDSFENAKVAGNDWSLKTIAVMRKNTEAGFDHLEALAGATTLSQFIELQTAFARSQSEAAADQAKEMQAAATKATEELFKPFKDAYSKTMSELKVA